MNVSNSETCPPENSCFTDKPRKARPQDIRRPRFSFFHIQLSKNRSPKASKPLNQNPQRRQQAPDPEGPNPHPTVSGDGDDEGRRSVPGAAVVVGAIYPPPPQTVKPPSKKKSNQPKNPKPKPTNPVKNNPNQQTKIQQNQSTKQYAQGKRKGARTPRRGRCPDRETSVSAPEPSSQRQKRMRGIGICTLIRLHCRRARRRTPQVSGHEPRAGVILEAPCLHSHIHLVVSVMDKPRRECR